MKQKKSKRIYLRISEEEFTEIKKRAGKFNSITQFVFSAIRDFQDSTLHEKMEARKRLAEYYSKYEQQLAHIGGNLNQAMRQVNEAAIAGHPTQALILTRLQPQIQECHTICLELRKELLTITKSASK